MKKVFFVVDVYNDIEVGELGNLPNQFFFAEDAAGAYALYAKTKNDDFLDPEDSGKTVEGYQAPVRAVIVANN